MNASNHLEAALAYAHTLGWAVFPLHHIEAPGHCSCPKGNDCDQAGKHPRTPQGFKDASTEAATIHHWWSQWPQANIGVATGPASGFDVLDVDPRHGGEDSLEEWEQDLGRLPDTVEQLTGGGGRHLLFAHQPGVRNKTDLAPGLDVRGDGGYIVVAPSTHASGRLYCWEASSRPEAMPMASWPESLLSLMMAVRVPQAASNGHSPGMEEGNPRRPP